MKVQDKILKLINKYLKTKTLLTLSPSENPSKKDINKVFQYKTLSETQILHFPNIAKKATLVCCLQFISSNKTWNNKKKWDVIAKGQNASNFIASAFKNNFFVLKIAIVIVVEITAKM